MPSNQPVVEFIVQEPNAEKNMQTIIVSGEIDRDTMPDFKEKMENALTNLQQINLFLDLAKLEFINSEGIGYLSDIYNRLSSQNKKIMILRASDRIMDIFQLVGLNQIIPCCDTEEECLGAEGA